MASEAQDQRPVVAERFHPSFSHVAAATGLSGLPPSRSLDWDLTIFQLIHVAAGLSPPSTLPQS